MTTHRRDRHVICKNCGHRQTIETEALFNRWIRNHTDLDSAPDRAALSIQNLDFVIHKYLVMDRTKHRRMSRQHLMLVEYKSHLATPPGHQRDTLLTLDAICRSGHKKQVNTLFRGEVRVFYHGWHVVRFDGTNPEDSSVILWDDVQISSNELVDLLRFDRDPCSRKKREDRSHHVGHPALCETWLR